MARETLAADRTYYVRSDALYTDAPGLLDSAAGACQTWQQAVDLAAAVDGNGHTITIQHGAEGAHTFTATTVVPRLTGTKRLILQGSSTPGNTDINVSGADTFYLDNCGAPVQFRQMTVRGGSGAVINVVNGSRCEIDAAVIFGAASIYHIWVHDNKSLLYILNATVTISGGATAFAFVNMGAAFIEASAFTLIGTPAFAGAFVQAINGGKIQSPSTAPATFAGAATGIRYNASMNGIINTFGGGASYWPGDSAGLTATGGQYA